MTASALLAMILPILLPIAKTAAGAAITWAGARGALYLKEKTGNEKASAALQEFTQAVSGAIATTEPQRLAMPKTLTEEHQAELRTAAVDTALAVVGQGAVKVLESRYGDVAGLAAGMVNEQVSYRRTRHSKIAD